MSDQQMRAIVHDVYGGSEVLRLTTVPKPVPSADEVLIRVRATTVNRTDGGFLSGKPYLVRLISGFPKPKVRILGNEFAGEIEAVGSAVTRFQVGERVFGYDDARMGGHAEYTVKKASQPLGRIPDGVSFETAAAILEGSHYALCNLKAAKVKVGQQVVVNGGTGGIGSAAVQLLRYFGAEVTAVCAGTHLELVRQLGAATVIDYTQADFTQTDKRFDFIFDAVGKSSFKKCKPLLKDQGKYISTELGKNYENPFLAIAHAFKKGKRVLFPIPGLHQEDVDFLGALVADQQFTPVIDRVYAFEDYKTAFEYVLSGVKVGNVILSL